MSNFTIFTILGATGDLTNKKILPSLYALFLDGIISKQTIKIVAFGRRDFKNGKYKEIIEHSLTNYANIDLSRTNLTEFISLFNYHQGQFDNKADFLTLAEKINAVSNTIFYLAVPTNLYTQVIKNLQATQLNKEHNSNQEKSVKIILEKPFGKDLKTSIKLDNLLKKTFKEEQIYRLDHYMGKEIINTIIEFRQENLQQEWNKDFIKKIKISTVEELGVETRGAFFDSVGALIDVGQNHLLEILATLTMNLTGNHQIERANILNKLKIFNQSEIKDYTFRAQYSGYREIEEVNPNSEIETYFKLAAFINDDNWSKVPIILESGKRCGVTKKEIVVEMKDGSELIFDFTKSIKLTFKNEKVKDLSANTSTQHYVSEYAKLFKDAFQSNRLNFITNAEVIAQWKFIDPIRKAWNENLVPLNKYKPDDINILLKPQI